jgi:hypothetical protein
MSTSGGVGGRGPQGPLLPDLAFATEGDSLQVPLGFPPPVRGEREKDDRVSQDHG